MLRGAAVAKAKAREAGAPPPSPPITPAVYLPPHHARSIIRCPRFEPLLTEDERWFLFCNARQS